MPYKKLYGAMHKKTYMNECMNSLFYYIIMTVIIILKKKDSYTLKSLCSMVVNEALKSLSCWPHEVSVLYVIIE